MANQLPQPANTNEEEAPKPAAETAPKPKLESVGPTLATTEKLLADHFAKALPKELFPNDLHLNLSVHLHEGKENLNFTFTSNEGFGLNATAFSEKVQQIIRNIPAFSERLMREDAEHERAILTAAETLKDAPNALRFVLKLNKAELIDIAKQLHGIETAEKALPTPMPQPQGKPSPETAHDTALCASGTCGHDHKADKPAPTAEASKTSPEPTQTPPKASNDNLQAANENVPLTTIEAPAAHASRLAEPVAKSVSAS